MKKKRFLLALFLLTTYVGISQRTNLDSLARKATDPTSVIWQLQFEDFWIVKFTNTDLTSNRFRIRAVIPLKGGESINYCVLPLTLTTIICRLSE